MIHSFKSMHLSGLGLFTELCNHHHSQSENISPNGSCVPTRQQSFLFSSGSETTDPPLCRTINWLRVSGKRACLPFPWFPGMAFPAVPQRGIWGLEYIYLRLLLQYEEFLNGFTLEHCCKIRMLLTLLSIFIHFPGIRRSGNMCDWSHENAEQYDSWENWQGMSPSSCQLMSALWQEAELPPLNLGWLGLKGTTGVIPSHHPSRRWGALDWGSFLPGPVCPCLVESRPSKRVCIVFRSSRNNCSSP